MVIDDQHIQNDVEAGHHSTRQVELTQGIGVFRLPWEVKVPARRKLVLNVILTRAVGASGFLTHFVYATARASLIIQCRDAVTHHPRESPVPEYRIQVTISYRFGTNRNHCFSTADCWLLGQHVCARTTGVSIAFDHHAVRRDRHDGHVRANILNLFQRRASTAATTALRAAAKRSSFWTAGIYRWSRRRFRIGSLWVVTTALGTPSEGRMLIIGSWTTTTSYNKVVRRVIFTAGAFF